MKKKIWVEWIGLWGSGKTTSIENISKLLTTTNCKVNSSQEYFLKIQNKGKYKILRNVLSVLSFWNLALLLELLYLYFPVYIKAIYKKDIIIKKELRSFLRSYLARIYHINIATDDITMWEGEYHLLPVLNLHEKLVKKFLNHFQKVNSEFTNIFIVLNADAIAIKTRLLNDQNSGKNCRFLNDEIEIFLDFLDQFILNQNALVQILKERGEVVYQQSAEIDDIYNFILQLYEKSFNPDSQAKLENHFMCVGAQRAGTTSFYDMIKNHPDVNISSIKEVHYYDNIKNYRKGFSWYCGHFNESTGMTGECSPDYLIYSYVPERIKKDFGDNVKLIFILRNPIERAYSQFNFHIMKGKEERNDFVEAMNSEVIDRENIIYNEWYDPAYYLSRSLYFNQIQRYCQIFNKDNLHFVLFEELFGPQKQFHFNQILYFLGLSEFTLSDDLENRHAAKVPSGMMMRLLAMLLNGDNKFIRFIKSNISIEKKDYVRKFVFSIMTTPKKISKKEMAELNNKFFREDILKLQTLIDKDLSSWLK